MEWLKHSKRRDCLNSNACCIVLMISDCFFITVYLIAIGMEEILIGFLNKETGSRWDSLLLGRLSRSEEFIAVLLIRLPE